MRLGHGSKFGLIGPCGVEPAASEHQDHRCDERPLALRLTRRAVRMNIGRGLHWCWFLDINWSGNNFLLFFFLVGFFLLSPLQFGQNGIIGRFHDLRWLGTRCGRTN